MSAPDQRLRLFFVLSTVLCLLLSLSRLTDQSQAASFEAGGLVFSDELGGFRLVSASGEGTSADPIILIEELTSLRPAVLTIRPAVASKRRSIGRGVLRRSLIKVVVNRSSQRWSGFDLELRDPEGRASRYSDGLSFDQPSLVREPLSSDRFADNRVQDEPYDRLRFDRGFVAAEDVVRLSFSIVDVNALPVFYLAQEPILLMSRRRFPEGIIQTVQRPDAERQNACFKDPEKSEKSQPRRVATAGVRQRRAISDSPYHPRS